jgi:hypothetical protein
MPFTIQIHVLNEEPIVAEIENLPTPGDNLIIAHNPRTRDGKDLRNLVSNVTLVILPVSRIHLVQVLPGAEEEKVVGFVRD